MSSRVARLSSFAARLLLSLTLYRRGESSGVQAEFAIPGGRSMSSGLRELGHFGLTIIINDGSRESKAWNEKSTTEDADTLAPLLDGGLVHTEAAKEARAVANEDAQDPIDACLLADQAKDRKAQIAALRVVWREVFPEPEYSYSTLTDSTAKEWLRKYETAEFIGDVLLDLKPWVEEKGPIEWPRAAVSKALGRHWEYRTENNQDDGAVVEIDDFWRDMARRARVQAGYE